MQGSVAELDALAIREDEFKQLVTDEVDRYYNRQIWEREKSKYSDRRVKQLLKKRIKFLD